MAGNSAKPQTNARVVLTVSGRVAPNIKREIAEGARPLADYVAISQATGATLIDWTDLANDANRTTALVTRLAGSSVGLAHHIFTNRSKYDAVIADGEQVGIPLALMLRFAGRRRPLHIMIAHRVSPLKKRAPIRLLGLNRYVDVVLVYSSSQLKAARKLFDRSDNHVEHIDFMVDSKFFDSTNLYRGTPEADRPIVCTAGQVARDYSTLLEAVQGLDVDVIVASASPWSKRPDNAGDHSGPPTNNVTLSAFSQAELRELFTRSDMLVVPLLEVDFQAGTTTILEGMAMGLPVICSAIEGQTDIVVDGINGRYIPPGNPLALRRAIEELVANPDAGKAMGRRGRELVESRMDVRSYAQRFAKILDSKLGSR